MKNIILIIKGFIIGSLILIPGLSGGLICIILLEYENIIYFVSNIFKNFKASIGYLLLISLGGILGLISFSKPLSVLYNNHYNYLYFFVLGVLIMSIIILLKSFKKLKINGFIWIMIGFILLLLINKLPKYDIIDKGVFNYFYLLMIGIIISIGLILPGISVSHVFLILGLYDYFLTSINTLDLKALFPFFLSTLIGIVVTLKLLNHLMIKYKEVIYYLVIGFLIGSIFKTFYFKEVTINYTNIDTLGLSLLIFFSGLTFTLGLNTINKFKIS